MQGNFSTNYRNYLREFILGATTPSLPALIGTVGVALSITIVTLFLLLKLLTPDFMAKYGYYFMKDKKDEYAYLTTKTLQISKIPATTIPLSVVLIGKSNGKEALDAKYLEQVLLKETQSPIVVYKLMVGGISPREETCVLDNIRDKLWGVVVLQVQPSSLALGRKYLKDNFTGYSRLALYCPTFDEEMPEAGAEFPQRENHYFFDHHKFFIARLPFLLLNAVRGPRQWSEYTEGQQGDANYFPWKRVVKRLSIFQKNYQKHSEENFKSYLRLIERLRKNSRVQIAFLEAATNPEITSLALSASTPEVKEVYEQYQIDMQKFTQKMNVPYWNLGKVANLESTDFVDYAHIKKQVARQRYTKALAVQLAVMLTELKKIKEAP